MAALHQVPTPNIGSAVAYFNQTYRAKHLLTAWAEAMQYSTNSRAPDDQALDKPSPSPSPSPSPNLNPNPNPNPNPYPYPYPHPDQAPSATSSGRRAPRTSRRPWASPR